LEAGRVPSVAQKRGREDIWQARINRDWRFYFVGQDGILRADWQSAHPRAIMMA
jgi:hypothetical protein